MRAAIAKKPEIPFDEAVKAAPYLRAYAEGKKRPTVQIIKIVDKSGNVKELFAKKDALGRMTIQTRDPDVTRKSPKVVAKDVAFKACMIALDELVKSKAEGGGGSGLDYAEMAKVRSECMKKVYNQNKTNLLSAVENRMKQGEDWESIVNQLSEIYKSDAKSIIEKLIKEKGGEVTAGAA